MHLNDDNEQVRAACKDPKRVSAPYMTKYEFSQLMGLRTTLLSKGAPELVDLPADHTVEANMELRNVALRELKEASLPLVVKRTMPNGKYEVWLVDDLDLTAVRHLMRGP